MATIDLTTTNATTTIGGVKFTATEAIVSGTGGYFTFLAVADNDGTEEGFNHDSAALLNTDASKTQSLQVGQLEAINQGGTDYYVFRLDMNEPGNATGAEAPITLNEFKLYTSATVATSGNYVANDGSGDPGLNFTKIFDLDAGGDNTLLMKDLSSGSGGDDYLVLVSKSLVDAAPNTYLSLYWQFSAAQGGFEEARALTVPFVAAPAINVEKLVTSITDGSDFNATGQADSAGDIINYAITIQNTGNVALTGVTVTDAVESYGATNATYASGDAGVIGTLDIGETWTYTANYTLLQADFDNNGGGDGDIDNLAVGDTGQTDPDSDDAVVELVRVASINVDKTFLNVANDTSDFGGTNQADSAGDTINYRITIQNTGNIALTGVTVTDAVESYGATNATYASGDAGVIGTLDVGETWTYNASYTLTQADLNNNGAGDGDIDNLATGDTAQTEPDTDTESVPLVRSPSINVTKVFTNVANDTSDFGGTNQADSVGDTINYAITLQNTGNVDLTGVTMSDVVQAYLPTNPTYVSGDAGVVGTLEVGETWNYTSSYTLTQADLDGKGGGDSDIDNVATGDTAQTDPDTASAEVPLVLRPAIDIEKYVQINGGAWQDADTAPGPTALVTSDINFKFVVTNTGNVSLTNVSVSDDKFDLDPGAGTTWAIGNLAVGASTEFILGDDEIVTFQVGQHTNVGTVTGSFGAAPVTDNDAANYWGTVGEGLSHGYWKTHPEDWDAPITLNQSFETYFGIDLASWSTGGSGKKASTSPDVTFEQALALTGGGAYALAREAVAAVLNYYDENIDYGYDLATIKSMVKTAYDTSIYDPTKNLLENENTSGDWF